MCFICCYKYVKQKLYIMEKETWKDIFCRQVSTGKYWKNLFKDEFETHQFLDRSDAVHICKKAQADAYENIINKLQVYLLLYLVIKIYTYD